MAQNDQAKFLEGSLLRHITVMALSSTAGLMAVFLVDFVDMIFISMLGKAELAAAVGYAGAVLFFTTSFGIGMAIAAGAVAPACPADSSSMGMPPCTHASSTSVASGANRSGGTTKQFEFDTNGRSRNFSSPPAIR